MHRSVFIFAVVVALTVLTIAPSAFANQPPKAVASAGVDLSTGQVLNQVTLFIGPSDSGIAYTITGGGSSDPDGDALTYRWDCTDQAANGKCIFLLFVAANQVNFRPTFPAGTFDITLTVDDGHGHTATDFVRVKVLVDLSPPTVTPPDDESVSATEAGGARGSASSQLHHFLFDSAMANDNSTAVFTHLPPRVNGVDVDDNTLFPHGTTKVTFRIADTFGNVGTATADVFVTDLQSGDLFVGVQSPVAGGPTKGLVQRIRAGVVTDFCESPDPPRASLQPGDPVFWNRPDQIVVDSKGRVTFLAALNFGGSFSPSAQNGWGLLRCGLPGQPPEQLGIFPQGSHIDPGWPEPLPGRTFFSAIPTTGLHLRKTKHVLIDDNVNNGNPQIVTEEKYVLAFQDSFDPASRGSGGHIGSLSLNTKSLVFAEDDLSPVGVGFTTTDQQDLLPEMFFHSKIETISSLGLTFSAPVAKTYVTKFGVMRRIHQPFEIQLTADTLAGTVQLGVQAFGGFTEMPSTPITDDVTIPNASSGCNPFPPIRGDWPTRLGSYSVLQSGGVIFEKDSGLMITSGFSMPAWSGHLDEALFDLDAQNDPQGLFARPESGCAVEPVVNFTPLAGRIPSPYTGPYDRGSTGQFIPAPDRMAASPNGLFGTIASQGRVVHANGGQDLIDVATGLLAPRGLGAFPPQLGNVQLTALIIRIDSPVDVVLIDALGRRVGVQNGQTINEFGSQAHDSGAQTHPRLYIVQHPQPGSYALRSTGTGSGPFKVHVYSVDSEKHVAEHIVHSGDAQPGSAGTHDFELSARGSISFANSSPIADAGFDKTANGDSSGNATFVLDGSRSSNPDGDTLTFTWAGPFGILSAAQTNATLGVGEHVLTLTVDDGKGGVAEDEVIVTVNAVVSVSANAGPDKTVRLGSVVTLQGAGASDGPGPLSFSWTQTGGPAVTANGANTATLTFTPTQAGIHTFGLVVSDGPAIAADGATIAVPRLGDIDVDDDVDRDDLKIVTGRNGTPADGPNDLKDVNGDGNINVADARRLTLLCTRPQCAVQ